MNNDLFIISNFFIIHDFEEIIWGYQWLQDNFGDIKQKVSQQLIVKGLKRVFDSTLPQICLGVAEEFIIASGIAIFASTGYFQIIFIGVAIGYEIHALMHVFQSLWLGKYVPAIVTAVLTGVEVAWELSQTISQYQLGIVLISGLMGTVVIIANLLLVFRISHFLVK